MVPPGWCLVLFLVGSCAAFKVSAPAGRLVAVRGQPAVLGCEFTPDSPSNLSSLVVTWLRKDDQRVVHSFYYKQDQLDRQSADYRNRTALFVEELKTGNASLRIEPVGPEDEGQYLCKVSNTRGTDKATVKLEYGAFYTEPRLSVFFSCSNVTVRYETEGFPEPDVRWLGDQGQNLSHHMELTESPDEPTGLYRLRSSYVTQSPALNVTFTLTNQLLGQHLQRPMNLTHAFYTEPRLSVFFSCSNVTVRYETEGFPEPDVRWLGDQGQNLSHHMELTESPDEPTGLYRLRSSYVTQSPALNVTFTLTNQLLGQHLQRPMNLTHGENCGTSIPVVLLTTLCLLLLISCIVILLVILRKKALLQSIFSTYQAANQEIQIQRHAG